MQWKEFKIHFQELILHSEKKGLRFNNLEAFEINKSIHSGTTKFLPILKVQLSIASSVSN